MVSVTTTGALEGDGGIVATMTDIADQPTTVDKGHRAYPEETRGLIVSSPVMPQVVEGTLTPPPLTAPAPPPAAAQADGGDD